MDAEQIKILEGRDLDRAIAERVFKRDPMTARRGLHKNGDVEYHWGYPAGHDIAPYYSVSRDACALMEVELIKQVHPGYYTEQLERVLEKELWPKGDSVTMFSLITASPVMRCRAALLALAEVEAREI
jgi:hypothetical protein